MNDEILLEQTNELVLKLDILKYDISLLIGM